MKDGPLYSFAVYKAFYTQRISPSLEMVDINQLISQSTTVLVQLQNVLQPTGVALKLKMIGLTQLVAQSTTVAASLPFSWLGVTLLVLALVIRSLISTMRSKGKLPPGPRGLPFLGNLFQIPDMPWLRFTEWKDEFGMCPPSMEVESRSEPMFEAL